VIRQFFECSLQLRDLLLLGGQQAFLPVKPLLE
jgi:hypothetical protein